MAHEGLHQTKSPEQAGSAPRANRNPVRPRSGCSPRGWQSGRNTAVWVGQSHLGSGPWMDRAGGFPLTFSVPVGGAAARTHGARRGLLVERALDWSGRARSPPRGRRRSRVDVGVPVDLRRFGRPSRPGVGSRCQSGRHGPGAHRRRLRDSGIDAVSLANNHMGNAGPQGEVDTIRNLDSLGVAHAGAGSDSNAARQPAWLAAGGLRIAFLAYDAIQPGYWAAA